jgi:REP element-mobilizing transposase RayT
MRVLRSSRADSIRSESGREGLEKRPRATGRGRLVIVSGKVYELTLKIREGLPFIPLRTMNLLLESAMAQACYVTKMSICHYVWMANHAHILVVARDPESLAKFYGIIKKSLTDFIKKLLGKDQLRLWEGRKVHLIPTPETVLERIAYFYSNPGQADLVETIEEYPGSSSFNEFRMTLGDTGGRYNRNVPWIRVHYVSKLAKRQLSDEQDIEIESDLCRRAFYENELRISPNAWLEAFGIGPEQGPSLNQTAFRLMRDSEFEARERRRREDKCVIGAERLRRQKIMRHYKPEKKSRAPIVICRDPEIRRYWILDIQRNRRLCTELYQKKHSRGLWTDWPAGVFPSRSPVRACRLG